MDTLINGGPFGGFYWPFRRLLSVVLVAAFCAPVFVHGQAFTEMQGLSDSLRGLATSAAAWGDYDGDGDLDLVVSGNDGGYYTNLYRNDGQVFSNANAGLTGLAYTALEWIDMDTDGDLDLLIAGADNGNVRRIFLYRNDAGQFTAVSAGLPAVNQGGMDCGDFDNDGDTDIVLAGTDSLYVEFTRIYRNDMGVFTDIGAGLLEATEEPGLAWGDYDVDGDLDLVVVGVDSALGVVSKIYRNDAGQFIDIGAPITGLMKASVAWGDYDNDDDLDLVAAGSNAGFVGTTVLYRNDGGVFVDAQANLQGLMYSSVAWADFDHDGDLDLLITGTAWPSILTILYRNDGGTFVDIGADLVNVYFGDAKWGDHDNDGDLDIAIIGWDAVQYYSKIYRNNSLVANAAPAAPTQFTGTASNNGTTIDFSWAPPTDDHTAAAQLTYRVWAGTSTNSFDVTSTYADPNSGWRRVAELGLIQDTTWSLKNLTPGQTYFACVSAIDGGLMGSPCSNQVSVVTVVGRDQGRLHTFFAGPNPTHDRIKVAGPWTDGSVVHWALRNPVGQSVPGMEGNAGEPFELDLQGLPAGVYWLQMESAVLPEPAYLKVIKE